MTSSVVLDSNVIVGYLDQEDSLHQRARALLERLEHDHSLVLLDFIVAEALSALCRRAFERRHRPPDLGTILGRIRTWHRRGQVVFGGLESETFDAVLGVVEETQGELNFNDARIVVLQRAGTIGEVASFDPDFDKVEGFRRIS
jgi:predicted nucleic acid-binding protein